VRVDVRWQLREGTERLLFPEPGLPILQGADRGKIVWTVYVPAGQRVNRDGASAGARDQHALAADLARAHAFLRAAQLLAPRVREPDDLPATQFLAVQERFLSVSRRLECELAMTGDVGSRDQLTQQLKAEFERTQTEFDDLCRAPLLDQLRARAGRGTVWIPETGIPLAPLQLQGAPVTLLIDAPGKLPEIELVAQRDENRRRAIAKTLLLVFVLGAALLLWHLRSAHGWLKRTWPEQVALLGLAGCLIWAPNAALLALLLLAGCARLTMLARSLFRRSRRKAAPTVTAEA
jgi:hypothetical protein